MFLSSTSYLKNKYSIEFMLPSPLFQKNMRGYTKNQNLFIKNCVFILIGINFSHLQISLHWMQYTYWLVFPTAHNSFGTCQSWCLAVLLPFFCFTSSTSAKHFLLKMFFHPRNQHESRSRGDQVKGRVGKGDQAFFGQKPLNTALCGQESF